MIYSQQLHIMKGDVKETRKTRDAHQVREYMYIENSNIHTSLHTSRETFFLNLAKKVTSIIRVPSLSYVVGRVI